MKQVTVMGRFNIEVSNSGKDIKVFRRRIKRKELLFAFVISDAECTKKEEEKYICPQCDMGVSSCLCKEKPLMIKDRQGGFYPNDTNCTKDEVKE
jgi:hypothetical protein